MKYLLFIFFFILLSTTSKSQVWIKSGATWHYNWHFFAWGGFIKIHYDNDTILQGKNCQKLSSLKYNFAYDQFGTIHFLGVDTMTDKYTYNSGDTVFHFVNNQFYILYNFGAAPGDTWDLGVDTSGFLCGQSYARVDSIGTIELNGQTHRWISLSATLNSSVSLYGKAVERIGSIDNYLFPLEVNCDTSSIADFPSYTFACFEDDSFPLYNRTISDCEYLLYIGVVELNDTKSNYLIYPNPSNEIININSSSNNSFEIIIYTIKGQQLRTINNCNDNTQIDISTLSDGVYIFRIIEQTGNSIFKRFIKFQ